MKVPVMIMFEVESLEELNAYAGRHDVSRSEAVRRFVDLGLEAETVKPAVMVDDA